MKEKFLRFSKCVKSFFLDALYPEDIKCCLCGDELSPNERFLCARCQSYVAAIEEKVCPKCGNRIVGGFCSDCGGRGFRFRSLTAIYPYDAYIKRVVLDRKDGGKPWLSGWFSKAIADKIVASGIRYNAIIYPPSGEHAIRRRGFDHMKRVADGVAERLGIPAIQIFQKSEDTEKQAKKDKAEREAAARRAYTVRETPIGKTFALLDDVATTCATLDALSAALLEKLPEAEIDCYTFARTLSKETVSEPKPTEKKREKKG